MREGRRRVEGGREREREEERVRKKNRNNKHRSKPGFEVLKVPWDTKKGET